MENKVFDIDVGNIDVNQIVGNNLKRLIKRHGYQSQGKFAREIDTDTSYLNTILNGKRGLGPDLMQRVIDVLKIHPKELFQENEPSMEGIYSSMESELIRLFRELKTEHHRQRAIDDLTERVDTDRFQRGESGGDTPEGRFDRGQKGGKSGGKIRMVRRRG